MTKDFCVEGKLDDAFLCCRWIVMRAGIMGTSPSPLESRHRSTVTGGDTSKIKFSKSKDFKAVKLFNNPIAQRGSICKFRSLKVILFTIICGTFLSLLYSPAVHLTQQPPHLGSRFMEVGWIWSRYSLDPRYASQLNINGNHISKAIAKLDRREEKLRIALLNFNTTEVNYWQQLLPHAESWVVHLEYANINITWNDLYPEWIDEEEEYKVPSCPHLPKPEVPRGKKFDLVAVKLPGHKSGNSLRDVARLHLHLAAAKLTTDSEKGKHRVHVLFVTNIFPIPNLFPCKNLVQREGDVWLYKPDLKTLREKLQLPVGSCELAVPLEAKVRPHPKSASREAYATILHSVHVYVCGAITAAHSIRMAGSTRDLVILVDESISNHHRSGLEAAGWKVRTIQRIRNPKAERHAYNKWNYSKFRLWQLTDYDKIIFIDADLLILRNIDFLFSMPEITATGNDASLFNSGVMIIEPSNCTFQLLMEHINEIESYNGGDQGYLNEVFTWWHRMPKHMNFLKHYWVGDPDEVKEKKTKLFGADPSVLYALHYLGLKPWRCFRDYDCNWNVDVQREFASDVAHARWWKLHDTMPEHLQYFCLLTSEKKAGLEWDRRQAEKANFSDGHWRRNISDRRRSICFEEFCFRKSMLWHWGEMNWTDDNPAVLASKFMKLSDL